MATASRLGRAALFTLVLSGYLLSVSSRVDTALRQVPATAPRMTPMASAARAMLDAYCVTCHNQRLKTAGLALDTIDVTSPHEHPEIWERVVTRLRAGSMPIPALIALRSRVTG